jgi:hypothetical protein
MYVDSYESEEANQSKSAQDMLAPCIDVALQVSAPKKLFLIVTDTPPKIS